MLYRIGKIHLITILIYSLIDYKDKSITTKNTKNSENISFLLIYVFSVLYVVNFSWFYQFERANDIIDGCLDYYKIWDTALLSLVIHLS